jgi:hypothetical protein
MFTQWARMQKLTCIILLLGAVAWCGFTFVRKNAFAQTGSNSCCAGPWIATPNNPPYPSWGCGCGEGESSGECVYAGNCSGGAWQTAMPGECKGTEHFSYCDGNGPQTLVTISNGYFACHTDCPTDCVCGYHSNEPPETDNVQVRTCLGDGC